MLRTTEARNMEIWTNPIVNFWFKILHSQTGTFPIARSCPSRFSDLVWLLFQKLLERMIEIMRNHSALHLTMSLSPPAQVQTPIERSYVAAELNQLSKADLIKLVERQITKWPTQRPFQRSRVRVEELKLNLLSKSNGFSTVVPIGDLISSRKSHSRIASDVVGSGPVEGVNRSRQTQITTSSSVRDSSFNPSQTSSKASGLKHVLIPPTPISNIHLAQTSKHPDITQTPLTPYLRSMVTLKLLINDTRFQEQALRRSQAITVPYVDEPKRGSKEYNVKFSDIYNSLQQMHTALDGVGELTFCDPDEPDYGQILMKGDFHTTVPSADVLVVPPSKILKLNVTLYPISGRHLSQSLLAPVPLQTNTSTFTLSASMHMSQLLNDPNSKPLEIAESRNRRGPKSAMVDELVIQASQLPGYETFKAGRHRVLQYEQVAAHWEFAATFSATHFRQRNVKSKKSIADALGIRTTSLAAAEQGHELIQLYGAHGSHESLEVATELASGKTGAVGLMDFLRAWEEMHPVAGTKAEMRRLKRRNIEQ
ncbi:hypothetical protein C8R41DRAFT_923708 [Lentinula lateritia]|uniref:Uncharacterized protein n=1 Tax=Lentinula lateritia TaxID=40482 RepID=A0ABQ8V5A2_9AGAR|nr:hypothetical protein C8R41DRAFT_923708 [Lentinula lateritia]